MPTVELEYTPREVQTKIHKALKRFSVIVMHRRGGKTVLCINQLIDAALRNTNQNPRYAYISPFYVQSKSVAWDYLKQYTAVIPGVTYNESELRCDLPNGARITLYGADNYHRMRGIYLDGVVLDEVAQMPPRAWTEVIRPSLSDRKGWAIFIGTPQGKNAFYELYEKAKLDPEWYAGMFKASETGIIDPGELESARKGMSRDDYEQEFECSFSAAIKGAYYSDELKLAEEQNRLCAIPYSTHLLVDTHWDLGFDDATSIIFKQQVGKEIRIIDFEEHNGESLEYYVSLLRDKGYKYGTHYLPHDAAAKRLEGGGQSIEEQLQRLGLTTTVVVPVAPKLHSIQRVRSLFNRFWIDNSKEKTRYLIDCISRYHKEWDDNTKTFKNKPDHDYSSHSNDALQNLAMSLVEEYHESTTDDYEPSYAGRLA